MCLIGVGWKSRHQEMNGMCFAVLRDFPNGNVF